jgi:hypothetical protein
MESTGQQFEVMIELTEGRNGEEVVKAIRRRSQAAFDVEKGYKYIRKAIEATEGMTLSSGEKKKMFELNAKKLLKL